MEGGCRKPPPPIMENPDGVCRLRLAVTRFNIKYREQNITLEDRQVHQAIVDKQGMSRLVLWHRQIYYSWAAFLLTNLCKVLIDSVLIWTTFRTAQVIPVLSGIPQVDGAIAKRSEWSCKCWQYEIYLLTEDVLKEDREWQICYNGDVWTCARSC